MKFIRFNQSKKVSACVLVVSLLSMAISSAAVTTYSSRAGFETQTFTVTTREDFSMSFLNLLIGNVPSNEFVSGVITLSSNVLDSSGNYRASIKGSSHPDRFDNSQFASLESYGSAHARTDLRDESASILLSGTNQVFGMDLGSFAAQTTAFFRTNLGNSFSFTGAGNIGQNRFAGAISDQEGEYFTRVDFVITGGSSFSDGFGVDNLVAGTIPEPSGIIVLTCMIPFLTFMRKRC